MQANGDFDNLWSSSAHIKTSMTLVCVKMERKHRERLEIGNGDLSNLHFHFFYLAAVHFAQLSPRRQKRNSQDRAAKLNALGLLLVPTLIRKL